MKLSEWENKPRNQYMILLHKCGTDTLQIDSYKKGELYPPSKDITNTTVTVYNMNTDRVSDKSAYKDHNGKLYIKCKKSGYGKTERLYLDDFC